jgi:Na+/H+ antiporter NhaD/arsenite permease-like protein
MNLYIWRLELELILSVLVVLAIGFIMFSEIFEKKKKKKEKENYASNEKLFEMKA